MIALFLIVYIPCKTVETGWYDQMYQSEYLIGDISPVLRLKWGCNEGIY